MRDVLIEHMDGRKVPVNRKAGSSYWRTMNSCLARKLIEYRRQRGKEGTHHPEFTVITDAGRSELAKALADWADALVRVEELRQDADHRNMDLAKRALEDVD